MAVARKKKRKPNYNLEKIVICELQTVLKGLVLDNISTSLVSYFLGDSAGRFKSVIATCVENVVELLGSNFSKEVIYEVAIGGTDGALQPLAGRLDALHKAIASLAAVLPKTSEAEEEHVSRTFTPAGLSENLSWTAPSLLSSYGI
uniref:Pumilio homolog 24 n=1 Tax=Elaeis guineensis var. tenera TaxID=51953 RepID=A0A6I9QWV4_ELAGV|nr:pumilio homolog 24 [Elaeis guineensis]XP_010914506.1 pumilio homolog 24 [Elaeis guineensis]